MVWADEFNWSPVEKSAEYSVTGALLIDAATKLAGRPLTLQGTSDAGWIDRGVLKALRALAAADAVGVHVLTLADGRIFNVQFAPGEPIEATPLARPELPPDSYPYIATLRLIEV
ncbi:hypothetical protein GOQ09_15705 [Variovorax paradoxus]|uniref:Uncharacterized protein n=2 Tax=Variovorax paradoxus TaxID=34073 RepID=A0A6I6HQY7_VARPD|nr:hypothetical protein GOQ09_15705 [Variovorax paradoxus]